MRVTARPFDGHLNGPFYLRGPRGYIDPVHSYYGADPTGVAMSTTQIQDACNDAITQGVSNARGAKVDLGVGTFKTDDMITLPHSPAIRGSVGLVGHSPQATIINYVGPTDRPAIFANTQWLYSLGNFSLLRSTLSRGTSIGLLIGSDVGTGTRSASGLIYPIFVQGWNKGIALGPFSPSVSAISEHVFQFVKASDCDIGVYADDYNTLNIVLQFLDVSNCGYGLNTGTAASVFVGAGAAADNTIADIYFGPAEGHNELRNFRSERPKRLLIVASGAVMVDNVLVAAYPVGHDGIGIEVTGALMTLRNSFVQNPDDATKGRITGGKLRLVVENSFVGGSQYIHNPSGGSIQDPTFVVAHNSYIGNVSTGPLAVYTKDASNNLAKRFQLDASGNALTAFSSKAGDPTASDIPSGQAGIWKNTSTGVKKYWANDAGTLVGIALA